MVPEVARDPDRATGLAIRDGSGEEPVPPRQHGLPPLAGPQRIGSDGKRAERASQDGNRKAPTATLRGRRRERETCGLKGMHSRFGGTWVKTPGRAVVRRRSRADLLIRGQEVVRQTPVISDPSRSGSLAWGFGAPEHLRRDGGHRPIDPVHMRPSIDVDQDVIDIRPGVEQKKMVSALGI